MELMFIGLDSKSGNKLNTNAYESHKKIAKLTFIQDVPGGTCQTSGGCSLY
jgi:hypothetical protein